MFTTLGALIGLAAAIVLIVRRTVPAYALIIGALIGGIAGGAHEHETGESRTDRSRLGRCTALDYLFHRRGNDADELILAHRIGTGKLVLGKFLIDDRKSLGGHRRKDLRQNGQTVGGTGSGNSRPVYLQELCGLGFWASGHF